LSIIGIQLTNAQHYSVYVSSQKNVVILIAVIAKSTQLVPERIFSSLSFFAIATATKEHYKEFDVIYGQIITEEDLPSLSPNFMSEGSKVDKGRKDALVSAKVRRTIICLECYKP